MTPPDSENVGPGKKGKTKAWIAIGCAAGLGILLAVGILLRADHPSTADVKGEPGISYTHDIVASVPWSIHVVKVDRKRKDIAFAAPLAKGKVLGVSTIAEQARTLPPEIGRALAGVNGDFYERDNPKYAGDPRGLQIVNGELVSAPSTVCIWFDADSNPHLEEVKGDFKITWPDGRKMTFDINRQRRSNMAVVYTATYGTSTRIVGGQDLILEREGTGAWLPLQVGQKYQARVREIRAGADTQIPADAILLSIGPQLSNAIPQMTIGAVVQISTATIPDLTGVKTAIGGGPAIIQNGNPFSATTPLGRGSEGYSERSKYERHPRSAVGWNTTHFFFVTVDGRQPGLSVGMTLEELAKYMVKLGCTDGMNFDGGNSASIWLAGEIMNSPCQGLKPVANSLLAVRKATQAAARKN